MIVVIVAAALAAGQPAPTADDPAQTLAAAREMYAQSCQVRAYGSYDDLCNILKKQMKEAEKAQKKQRAARAAAPVSAATPAAAPAQTTTSAPLTLR